MGCSSPCSARWRSSPPPPCRRPPHNPVPRIPRARAVTSYGPTTAWYAVCHTARTPPSTAFPTLRLRRDRCAGALPYPLPRGTVSGMRRRRLNAASRCRHQVRARSSDRRTASTSTSPCRRRSRSPPDRSGPCWCGCTAVRSWAAPAATTAPNSWRSGVTRSSSRSTTGWGSSVTSATPGWAPPAVRSGGPTGRPALGAGERGALRR